MYPRAGAGGQLFGSSVLVVPCAGRKDMSIAIVPSGSDTCKVEVTLESPDDLAATWFEIIAATNTSSVVTLTGPIAALRCTRVSGATALNKVIVYTPQN